MSDDAPSTAQVRAYLDQAVVDAADRWVGRSLDATAYADLVAAVLARREAMGSTELTRPMSQAAGSLNHDHHVDVSDRRDHHDHHGRHSGATGSSGTGGGSWPAIRVETVGAVAYGPASYDLVHAPRSEHLPVRPPGRHRSPAVPEPAPAPIDLSEDLSAVLSWLGRPDS